MIAQYLPAQTAIISWDTNNYVGTYFTVSNSVDLTNWAFVGNYTNINSTSVPIDNVPAKFFTVTATAIPGKLIKTTWTVTLTWDAVNDGVATGYKAYWGVASGVYTNSLDVGTNLTANIPNLPANTRFYMAATSYSSFGMESLYSNEINFYTPKPNGSVKAAITLAPLP